MLYTVVLYYFIAISIISILICCYDKLSAVKGGHRIPEKSLMLLSVLGGSAAMYITMQIIRHKTRHKKFMIGLPFIIFIQISLFTGFLKFFQ